MNIKATCIDYTKASVEEREAFSLVPSKIQELEQSILQTYQLDGCIILSTCNRTELWISAPKAVLSSLSPTAIFMRCFASTCRTISVIFYRAVPEKMLFLIYWN